MSLGEYINKFIDCEWNTIISHVADKLYSKMEKPLFVLRLIMFIAGLIMLIYGIYKKEGLLIFFGIIYVVPALIPTDWVYNGVIERFIKDKPSETENKCSKQQETKNETQSKPETPVIEQKAESRDSLNFDSSKVQQMRIQQPASSLSLL